MADKKRPIHQMTIKQFEALFPDETACCDYLVRHRWPMGVFCPRCGNTEGIATLRTRPYHWQCYECAPQSSYRFSHLTGTIFENTNKPLRDWFRVIHMMLTSKKGVSALQVHRVMGFGSYETALYMCNRIRAGLADKDFHQLMGIVELDETFVGGKAQNRHKDKRGGGRGTGPGVPPKTAVVGAVSRSKKTIVARVIGRATREAINRFVHETVATKVSVLATDQWGGYKSLDRDYERHSVDHSIGQYVVGAIHTNTIEGFWSLLKRGIVGTFHKVSPKYLPLYVAEFCFRYNNRENDNIFGAAISQF